MSIEEKSFRELSDHLVEATTDPSAESDAEYRQRVRDVFSACGDVLADLDMRRRYKGLQFLTFSGVDPNDLLEAEEMAFVDRLNPPEVFKQFLEVIG